MLRYIDEVETADRVQAALEKVYIEKKTLTRDVGGTSGTKGFTAAVLAAL
jgi:isocitrate dehydrogenase (NAD+)